MSILDQISSDLKEAMKRGEGAKTGVLRFVLAQIHNREIEKKTREGVSVLSDEEVIEVLRRELKKRKEAIAFFKQGGRDDLVLKEEQELSFFEGYLPKDLDKGEIEAAVDGLIREGNGDFNGLMREVMARFKGRVDGRIVGEIVKRKLGQS